MNTVDAYVLHGSQCLDNDLKNVPTSYFNEDSGVGEVFKIFKNEIGNKPVGIIGLGTGSAAPYAKEGQEFVFYEINPFIKEVAEKYFSYLKDSKGKISIVIGDAIEKLKTAENNKYYMIIGDAYNKGIVPKRTIDYSAINLYLEKLHNDGIILIHVSSQFSNLKAGLFKFINENNLYGFLHEEKGPGFFKRIFRVVLDYKREKYNAEITRKYELGKCKRSVKSLLCNNNLVSSAIFCLV